MIPTKHIGIGQSLLAKQRPLSGAEARMVRNVASCLKGLEAHCNKPGQGDGYHAHKPHHDPCHTPQKSCHTSPPRHHDSCHPQGCLKVDNGGTVCTPGGYKVEVTGPCAWKITGPDGKCTNVSGDPHVAESDGGKWDFQRASTFMLGDGTRVNVSTKPVGPNATVTSGLEIISGNDRVVLNDVEKGKGPKPQVTHDGFQKANSFQGKEVFVMGKETDDWSLNGREIIGSNNNGESFKLGNPLPVGTPAHHHPKAHGGAQKGVAQPEAPAPAPQAAGGGQGVAVGEPAPGAAPGPAPGPAPGAASGPFIQQLRQIFQGLAELMGSMTQLSGSMERCNAHCNHLSAPGTEGKWLDRRQQHLGRSFDDIGRMMDVFNRTGELGRSVQKLRGTFMA